VILCSQCGSPLRGNDRFCAACGAVAGQSDISTDPLVGRTIAGSYVVLDLVGVGGMGRVYRAEQRMLGRTVAIKVVHPHLLSDEQSVARFYNEAKAASRLNHPNSVSIIDFGRTDDGILYLVMEYLQGRDLARIIREDGPLPLARICEILAAVLAALGEAHALGVIHRDLKPENVIIERMRTGSDLIKVVDFGLAKLLGMTHAGASVTSPGLVCGTPDYMSPEQGRGLPLDGRADLYSVGVMLYELLTEQLPYVGETPTDVVLRHIQDSIPDPRDAAPHRKIPVALVDVFKRALSKQPEHRYQDASEMATDLRRVWHELQPAAREIACPACGVRSPSNKRFCGECGAQLQQPSSASGAMPRLSLPPGMVTVGSDREFVGRQPELGRLLELRDQAVGQLVALCVLGEPGIGKTRLLGEMAEHAAALGDVVIGAGPHDSGSSVPYHTIRTIVLSLLSTDGVGLARLADELRQRAPLVAAGMFELLEPTGLRGADGLSRAGAVAAALAHALRGAMQMMDRPRTLLIVDDLHRCDGLSIQVLGQLGRHTRDDSILLVTASHQLQDFIKPAPQTLVLRGFTMAEARAWLSGYVSGGGSEPAGDERVFVPLYLEQLRVLGLALDSVSHALPRRLADAVSQRMQRLSLAARRVLQAACVLGNRAPRAQVLELAQQSGESGLELLKSAGLVLEQEGQIEIIHPYVRDLVEASIPAEARKELHAHALGAATEAPLEVRAHHAHFAGETLSALMLLERTGDLATERGDPVGAVAAFRGGLDLVRRELLESGDTSLEEAMTSFSRKLGHALARAGDLTGAEGVLREALEFCAPNSISRALILLGLGKVLASRKRERDAYRLLAEGLEVALTRGDLAAQAAIHMTTGELRRSEGNLVGALSAFGACVSRLTDLGGDRMTMARAAVELATSLADAGDPQAREVLLRALELAKEAEAPYLEARVAVALALLCEREGDRELATSHMLEAQEASRRAGDAEGVARYSANGLPSESATTRRQLAEA
jgi:eukaryotic-like serine/threonine-protein kinase